MVSYEWCNEYLFTINHSLLTELFIFLCKFLHGLYRRIEVERGHAHGDVFHRSPIDIKVRIAANANVSEKTAVAEPSGLNSLFLRSLGQ